MNLTEAITDTISKFIQRFRPNTQKTTMDEIPELPSETTLNRQKVFLIERTRQAIIKQSQAMYDDDPRAFGVITTLAKDATKGGFEIVFEKEHPNNNRAQEIANHLISTLKLELDDWVRLAFRDGDTFLELAIDKARLIKLVSRKPTSQMYRNSNSYDRFDDPQKAYWFSPYPWAGLMPPGNAIWFADWQIVHARLHHDTGNRYGRPLFTSARKHYEWMTQGEFDVAVRRKTRAGLKFLHVIEGANANTIEDYKKQNRDTLNNPFSAIADFFTNRKGSIQTIQGDARLGDIADIKHQINTWEIASPLPLALLGYGEDLNRDVLKYKTKQYQEALGPISDWVAEQLVKPIIELQWLLQGIWPNSLSYTIRWPNKRTLTADDLDKAATAGLKLRALGWPDEIIAEILLPMIPGLSLEKLLKAMTQKKDSEPDETGRMATASEKLKSTLKGWANG